MILYSIVPAEVVFQKSYGQEEVTFFEAGYRGERIIVSQTQDGHCSISRLLSTSPDSFLNPAFQPGNTVDSKELDRQG